MYKDLVENDLRVMGLEKGTVSNRETWREESMNCSTFVIGENG